MRRFVKSLVFVICILLFTGLLTTSSRANEKIGKIQPAIFGPAYQLGGFIDIYLETNVDNIKPRIAYNNLRNEYLVVWTNIRGGGATKDIYARRVKGDGTLSSVFTITHNFNFHNYDPDVVYNPLQDEYLVVWTYNSVSTDSDIWARRITWNGANLDLPEYQEFQLGRPNDKSGKQINPAVTYNSAANEYLVVYENSFGTLSDIDAVRVQAGDGVQVGWRNIATGAFEYRSSPDVAYHPVSNSYLIAYTFETNLTFIPSKVVSKLASWNLSNLSNEIEICDGDDQKNVSIAVSDEGFITVWEQERTQGSEINARRISPNGIPLGSTDGFTIEWTDYNYAADVAYGSGRYLVVYQTARTSNTTTDYYVHGYYTVAGKDETIGSEIPIDRDGDSQMSPAVSCNSLGDCLVVEQDRKTMKGDYEIRGRFIRQPHIYLPLVIKR